MRLKKSGRTAFAWVIAFLGCAGILSADVLMVGPDEEYIEITDAVYAAVEGDAIIVKPKLKIDDSRVRVLIREGRLPAQMIGRTYAIDPRDLKLVKDRPPGRPKNKDKK